MSFAKISHLDLASLKVCVLYLSGWNEMGANKTKAFDKDKGIC